jgi:endonuclease YncB( thermonuclease family)
LIQACTWRLAVVLLGAAGCSGGALEDVAAQQQTRPAEAQYVASSRGEVYYWVGCDAWAGLNPDNLRWFVTDAEAEAAGYRPSQARGCAPQLETDLIEARPGATAPCVVSWISDGDTFMCEGGSRIRLLIADAPEAGQGPFADSATLLLERLMPVGSSVRLEFDVQVRDPYRRLLAYVYAGDIFVNRELVRRGLAHVEVYPPNVREVDALRAAADSARAERRGLWSGSAFECTPADHRAGRC